MNELEKLGNIEPTPLLPKKYPCDHCGRELQKSEMHSLYKCKDCQARFDKEFAERKAKGIVD